MRLPMNLNIKLLESPKEVLSVSLYKETITQLDVIAEKYNCVRMDLIRHAINNFIDSIQESK